MTVVDEWERHVSPSGSIVVAGSVFVVTLALWATGVVFAWPTRGVGDSTSWGGGGWTVNLLLALSVLAFPVVGLLICSRQPRNAIGWLLLAIGFWWGLADATPYADYGLNLHPGSLPAAAVVAALGSAAWLPAIGITGTFLIVLFPDGHLPTGRWRFVAWLSAFAIIAGYLSLLLTPGFVKDAGYRQRVNPFGVAGLGGVLNLAHLVILLVPVMMVASAISLVTRFRRARGQERLQLKWPVSAAAAVAVTYLIVEPLSAVLAPSGMRAPPWLIAVQDASLLTFCLIPTAIGFGVLRYRLFEIDVIIRRTLVYATLVALLAVVYLGGVYLVDRALQTVTGQSGAFGVTLSTLAVAALFQPLRRRIQRGVDRRFYRGKYDAAHTLEAFTSRLRDQIDLDALNAEMLSVVDATVQPRHASLWIRPSEPVSTLRMDSQR